MCCSQCDLMQFFFKNLDGDYGVLANLSAGYLPLRGAYQCVTNSFATNARSARKLQVIKRQVTSDENPISYLITLNF